MERDFLSNVSRPVSSVSSITMIMNAMSLYLLCLLGKPRPLCIPFAIHFKNGIKNIVENALCGHW